ncbi:hypothetical protein UA08_02481 [Talaromyces atroroseus]|uniref:Uncharacterized protein n=1 Tax=Talaromyces atroroseus TaxID=1441469 RepID=A0A225AJY3_TALAT|nr:hypothetical protein UA08_02481 [Talaromyces atroroseus]OKL61832.1 hypothetical protein UA08_02481 [Talaromyces atroroseus]
MDYMLWNLIYLFYGLFNDTESSKVAMQDRRVSHHGLSALVFTSCILYASKYSIFPTIDLCISGYEPLIDLACKIEPLEPNATPSMFTENPTTLRSTLNVLGPLHRRLALQLVDVQLTQELSSRCKTNSCELFFLIWLLSKIRTIIASACASEMRTRSVRSCSIQVYQQQTRGSGSTNLLWNICIMAIDQRENKRHRSICVGNNNKFSSVMEKTSTSFSSAMLADLL